MAKLMFVDERLADLEIHKALAYYYNNNEMGTHRRRREELFGILEGESRAPDAIGR